VDRAGQPFSFGEGGLRSSSDGEVTLRAHRQCGDVAGDRAGHDQDQAARQRPAVVTAANHHRRRHLDARNHDATDPAGEKRHLQHRSGRPDGGQRDHPAVALGRRLSPDRGQRQQDGHGQVGAGDRGAVGPTGHCQPGDHRGHEEHAGAHRERHTGPCIEVLPPHDQEQARNQRGDPEHGDGAPQRQPHTGDRQRGPPVRVHGGDASERETRPAVADRVFGRGSQLNFRGHAIESAARPRGAPEQEYSAQQRMRRSVLDGVN
jgi:hypothetical protein